MTEDWNTLTSGVRFITDLGKNTGTGDTIAQRYAVWLPEQDVQGKHRIAEVGNDLEELRNKYHIKAEDVFQIEV